MKNIGWPWAIILLCAVWWVPNLLFVPFWTYWQGTARTVSVELIAAPFRDSPTLQYRWKGDVYRSCPIVIDRQIEDAQGVLWTLKSSPLLPPLPQNEMGWQEYPLTVETPLGLPPGPSVYQATERPRCTWLQSVFPPRVKYPPVRFTVTRANG